ncbi:MAG TPA: nickel pincer cofactor biosynthesis protein LarC [Candidatus Eisenbacteria bacterium]|nr:nickel pincer cofactor biosynthesis protein LarC [Candidatus Eisenbacteria bacterium]
MRIAYGDLIGGVSGDMFLAALIDAGVPVRKLRADLKKIPTLRFDLKIAAKEVYGVRATRVRVLCAERERPRSWREVRRLIQRSRLDRSIKDTGEQIFGLLAAAEGKVHGMDPNRVHFHELGGTDAIVDVMAAAIGRHELGIERFYFSPAPLGRTVVRSDHGPLPIPGPATLELLKGVPVHGVAVEGETVTPTGAAIVRAFAKAFGEPPEMTVEKIGYGAGEREWPGRPNLFRLILGSAAGWQHEEMLVIETNIDDMNPEFYDHVFDRLFGAGARDVFLSPIQMKKNRPATLLRVIAGPADREKIARVLFEETSTIGIRYYAVGRLVLKRSVGTVKTPYGVLRVKIVEEPNGAHRAIPEYDDLKRIAAARNIPLKRLYDEVTQLLSDASYSPRSTRRPRRSGKGSSRQDAKAAKEG